MVFIFTYYTSHDIISLDLYFLLNMKEELVMAYLINENCISCGACEPECPVSCITAGDDKYVIDASTCIDCGACAGVCPVDACQPE